LRPSQCGLRYDFVWPHHVIIFVFQHMAVEHVAARVAFKAHEDGKYLSRVNHRRILPSGFAGLRGARCAHQLQDAVAESCGIESLALQNLKLHQMEMHGVGVVGGVDKAPFLGGTQFHTFRDRVLIPLAVDVQPERSSLRIQPLGQHQIPANHGCSFVQLGECHRRRKIMGLPFGGKRNLYVELHQLVQGRMLRLHRSPTREWRRGVIGKGDGLAFERRKINDQVGAFRRTQQKLVQDEGFRQEPAVSSDLVEGNQGGDVRRAFCQIEEKVKKARVGSV